ncbi:hypothetical protein FOZ60_000244 [Perkinsus olseni]|uniref:Uncharacterized protein n=1 Tax=Perkinsus olseni TaxID=32597 RepID=A0A7J6PK94_PEROL|nr:hypothetical protein FOZ60_000244 [Perkinsus olseni]
MREVSMWKVLNDNSPWSWLLIFTVLLIVFLQSLYAMGYIGKAPSHDYSEYEAELAKHQQKTVRQAPSYGNLRRNISEESRATYDALKALLQHPATLRRDPRAAGEGCLTGALPLHDDTPIDESQKIFSAVIGYKSPEGEDGDKAG